jgi:hypothetical protein
LWTRRVALTPLLQSNRVKGAGGLRGLGDAEGI